MEMRWMIKEFGPVNFSTWDTELKTKYFSRSAQLVSPKKLGPPTLISGDLKALRKLLLNHVEYMKMRWMTKNLSPSYF